MMREKARQSDKERLNRKIYLSNLKIDEIKQSINRKALASTQHTLKFNHDQK